MCTHTHISIYLFIDFYIEKERGSKVLAQFPPAVQFEGYPAIALVGDWWTSHGYRRF